MTLILPISLVKTCICTTASQILIAAGKVKLIDIHTWNGRKATWLELLFFGCCFSKIIGERKRLRFINGVLGPICIRVHRKDAIVCGFFNVLNVSACCVLMYEII